MKISKRLYDVYGPLFEQSTSMLDAAVLVKRRFERLTALMGAMSVFFLGWHAKQTGNMQVSEQEALVLMKR